jgi:hypothetical protein
MIKTTKIMLLEEELRIELLQKHIIALGDQNPLGNPVNK